MVLIWSVADATETICSYSLAKYHNFLFSKNQTFLGIICEMNKILTGTSKILSFRCDLTTGLFRNTDSILDTAEYIC